MNRAGHENIPTTQTYIRAAEAIREGFGEMFPPLPQVLFARPASPSLRSINRDSSDESSEIQPHVANAGKF